MAEHHPRRAPVLLIASLLVCLVAGCSRTTPTAPDGEPTSGNIPTTVNDQPAGGGTRTAEQVPPSAGSSIDGAVVEVVGYIDVDADGFGAGTGRLFVDLPPGFALKNADCNDANAAINPAATEVTDNGMDDDCDGSVDE